ncbi:MAG: hypothetical protein ABIK93_07010 [candidate division WOR-3 bacterium]
MVIFFAVTSVVLGIGSVVIAILGIIFATSLAKRTDKLIQTEDERAKKLIEHTQELIADGNRRTQELIDRMDRRMEEGNRRTQEILQHIADLMVAHR